MNKVAVTNWDKNTRCVTYVSFLLLFSSILFSPACEKSKTAGAIQQPSDSTASTLAPSGVEIPQHVIDYISRKFPGWTLPDTSDYIKTWWSFYEKDQIPYYTSVDINDDQALDYGLILKSSDSIQLVILLDSTDTFTHRKAKDFQEIFKGKDIQFGLMIEPPKRIDVIDINNNSLILTSNGIGLMNFENRQKIYYWNEGELKMFKTPER